MEAEKEQLAKLMASVEELTARVAKLEPQQERTDNGGEDADPARLDALVQERVGLVTAAQCVLGREVRVDGMSPREIRVAVLAKLQPALQLDGKSDEYVAARFDAAVEQRQESREVVRQVSPIVEARADLFRSAAVPANPGREVAPRLEDKWRSSGG